MEFLGYLVVLFVCSLLSRLLWNIKDYLLFYKLPEMFLFSGYYANRSSKLTGGIIGITFRVHVLYKSWFSFETPLMSEIGFYFLKVVISNFSVEKNIKAYIFVWRFKTASGIYINISSIDVFFLGRQLIHNQASKRQRWVSEIWNSQELFTSQILIQSFNNTINSSEHFRNGGINFTFITKYVRVSCFRSTEHCYRNIFF